jgi:hypothetical protein
LYIPTAKEATIPDQYILRYSQLYIHSEGQNKSMQLVPWLVMRKTRLENIPAVNEKIDHGMHESKHNNPQSVIREVALND